MGVVSQIFRRYADLRQDIDGEDHHLRWRVPTLSRPSRPRSRTRRESPLTSSASSSRASSSRMAALSRTTTSRRSLLSTWCSACADLEPTSPTHGRSHSQDALEVEEEAYASPPKEAPQDASTLQVIARSAMELPVEPVCQ